MDRRGFLKSSASFLALPGFHGIAAAQALRLPMPDVVVILPGIMGSVLAKDGKDLWAVSGPAVARALRTLGGNLAQLKLSGDSDTADTLDGITASRLVSDVHLIPGFWKIDGYSRLTRAVRAAFDVQPGANYHEFPYDWRRDIRVSAKRLARLSAEWLSRWQQKSGNRDARLILIAHSMGGLVGRYFIECLEGWRTTRVLIRRANAGS